MSIAKAEATAVAMAAAMRRIEADEDRAVHGFLDGLVGEWHPFERVKPGSRWVYRCRSLRSGEVRAFTGNDLVKMARAARTGGLPVVLTGRPWRDE